ncbi:VOC family protein [Priestia megaterium]|nr:VOC family protein [Priestia megaterium]
MEISNQKITTFLMFSGTAEEAMNHYVSIFDQSEIINIIRYGANEAGKEGSVMHAIFSLKGQVFMCIDNSNGDHHAFTPAMSLFVTCDTEKEIDYVFEKLSEEGTVLMPLAASPFSEKFGWVEDKYGVSWQLNLAKS